MNRRLLLLLPLAGFLVLAGFLYKGLFLDPRDIGSTMIGKPLPAFSLPSLEDPARNLSAEDFKGRPALLNVWATWCPTCYGEHTYLKELAGQGIYIVGMNYKDERDKAIKWLAELGNPYQINLYDPDGMLGLDLGVYGAPETFFIDSQGIIRYRHVGDINPDVWASTLKPIFDAMK